MTPYRDPPERLTVDLERHPTAEAPHPVEVARRSDEVVERAKARRDKRAADDRRGTATSMRNPSAGG